MRRGTREYEQALAARADPLTVVEVLIDGDVVASNLARENSDSKLSVLGNPSITYDAGRKVMTTIGDMAVTISDELVPRNKGDSSLAPIQRADLRISSGFMWNGRAETLPVALFKIKNTKLRNSGAGRSVALTLVDRATELQKAPFKRPVSIPSGANRAHLVNELVQMVYPDLEVNAPDISIPLAAMEIEEDTKLLDLIIDRILRPIGYHFYFDVTGKPQIAPPLTLDEDPVAVFGFRQDQQNLRIIELERLLTDEWHNGMILSAESTREADENGDTPAPFYAEAWADDVPSPIAYSQSMADADAPGAFPLIQVTQTLTNQDDVNTVTREAANIIALQPEVVALKLPYVPGLEARDVIRLSDPDTGTEGPYVVGKIVRPLAPGTMNVSTYERRAGASAYHHSPSGVAGHLAALGVTEFRERDSLPTRIGVVTAIDESGRPPVYTVDGVRRMRYTNHSGLIEVGDRVLWIPNGVAPYIEGTLSATPSPNNLPSDPGASEWFYTGDAAADHPAIGFRFWQGNANTQGRALFDTGIDPNDVLVAHVNSPEYSSMSGQWARPVTIKADGKAEIWGMKPGRPFKLTMIVKNDAPPAGTPTYDYFTTGNNDLASSMGAHEALALKYFSGTTDASGDASGTTGVSQSRQRGWHARVMVDGESRDFSLISQHGSLLWRGDTTRLQTTSRKITAGSRWANLPYVQTLIYSKTAAVASSTATAGSLNVEYLGKDKIGTLPEFQVVTYETTFNGGGEALKSTGVDAIEYRGAATFGIADDDYVVAAEMWSESANEWRLFDPVRKNYISGKTGRGIAFILKGSDTAQPV